MKGKHMNYREYLTTDKWKRVSSLVKQRDGGTCRVCNSAHRLNAHHRTYKNVGNELDHLDDLICLCQVCHELFHVNGRIQRIPRDFEFDVTKSSKYEEGVSIRAVEEHMIYEILEELEYEIEDDFLLKRMDGLGCPDGYVYQLHLLIFDCLSDGWINWVRDAKRLPDLFVDCHWGDYEPLAPREESIIVTKDVVDQLIKGDPDHVNYKVLELVMPGLRNLHPLSREEIDSLEVHKGVHLGGFKLDRNDFIVASIYRDLDHYQTPVIHGAPESVDANPRGSFYAIGRDVDLHA